MPNSILIILKWTNYIIYKCITYSLAVCSPVTTVALRFPCVGYERCNEGILTVGI